MSVWRAPAKINLFLHVVGRFDDGYHDLQTVYQLLDWCDELEFECTVDGSIRRRTSIKSVSEPDDLTVRAARLLRSRFPGTQGVEIRIRKNLPIGAGLGGGSSDAATTLIALNEIWDLGLKIEQLMDLGAEIGADVPVFIFGENAWAEGRGDRLSKISIPEQLYLVVFPNVAVSTKLVFRELRPEKFRERVSVDEFHAGGLGNDLENPARHLYPQLGDLIEWLSQWGVPRMSGSGSSAFIPIESRGIGKDILGRLPPNWVGRMCIGKPS